MYFTVLPDQHGANVTQRARRLSELEGSLEGESFSVEHAFEAEGSSSQRRAIDVTMQIEDRVDWLKFCDEVGADIQSRVTRLPFVATHQFGLIGAVGASVRTEVSLLGVLWSVFLTLIVDSMAITIAFVG